MENYVYIGYVPGLYGKVGEIFTDTDIILEKVGNVDSPLGLICCFENNIAKFL